VVLTIAVGRVVGLLQPARPGWVWGELNLWVLAILLLIFSARSRLRLQH